MHHNRRKSCTWFSSLAMTQPKSTSLISDVTGIGASTESGSASGKK